MLERLPASAWPYGLVVAVQDIGILSGKTDLAHIEANRTKLLNLLKELGIAVDRCRELRCCKIVISLIDDANDCSSHTSPLAKAKPHKLPSSCSPSFEKEHTSASVRAAMEETRGTVSKERFSILLV